MTDTCSNGTAGRTEAPPTLPDRHAGAGGSQLVLPV
jgi:hypothetical protein